MKVGYQGEPGAFSEEAIAAYLGEVEALGYVSFDALLAAVDAAEVDAGLLPCENSIHGSIARNYDLIAAYAMLGIVGETTHRVVQHLIGTPDAQLDRLTTVRSHPVALDQCGVYLRARPWIVVEPVPDTAGAVRAVLEQGDPRIAAIGPSASADRYGGRLLASAIQDDAENFTRFFLIARAVSAPPAVGRACLAFTLPHAPGTLHAALGRFAEAGANLRSLVTRPLVGRPFEYRFYAEIEGVSDSESAALARRIDPKARVLGYYDPQTRRETTLTGHGPPGILP